MTQNTQIWDDLGKSTFNTHSDNGEIDPLAADNILLAWPPILQSISKEFPNPKNVSVLDFGCGAGGFCNKLADLGFSVTGMDISPGMIDAAKSHSSKNITYIVGDQYQLSVNIKYHIVTSIMAFQFIDRIDETLKVLANSINKSGLLIFAVFNPAWVKMSLKIPHWFSNFDSIENPKKGLKTFGEQEVPVYIRTGSEYDEIALNNGLIKILEENPPFTSKFIQRYPDYTPNQVSEYLILGYRKM